MHAERRSLYISATPEAMRAIAADGSNESGFDYDRGLAITLGAYRDRSRNAQRDGCGVVGGARANSSKRSAVGADQFRSGSNSARPSLSTIFPL
jgi:hypothetical protein